MMSRFRSVHLARFFAHRRAKRIRGGSRIAEAARNVLELKPRINLPGPIRLNIADWNVQIDVSFEPLGDSGLLAGLIRATHGKEPLSCALSMSVNGGARQNYRVQNQPCLVQLPPPPATYEFEFSLDDGRHWSFMFSPPDED
jgi:hypothetical protein